jgi:hypothetical protein
MKKLINYLNKKGIIYQAQTYGSTYFLNAPALHLDGVQITFSYGDTKTNKHSDILYKTVIAYCNRYGYKIISHYGMTWGHTIHILSNTDAGKLATYKQYETQSRKSCENTAHIYKQMGLDKDINGTLKGIMEFWGDEYNNALKEETAA